MVNKELIKKGVRAKTELEQTLFNLLAVSNDAAIVHQINEYIQMAIRASLSREKTREKGMY